MDVGVEDGVGQVLPAERGHLLRPVQVHLVELDDEGAELDQLLVRDVAVVQDERPQRVLLPVQSCCDHKKVISDQVQII